MPPHHPPHPLWMTGDADGLFGTGQLPLQIKIKRKKQRGLVCMIKSHSWSVSEVQSTEVLAMTFRQAIIRGTFQRDRRVF